MPYPAGPPRVGNPSRGRGLAAAAWPGADPLPPTRPAASRGLDGTQPAIFRQGRVGDSAGGGAVAAGSANLAPASLCFIIAVAARFAAAVAPRLLLVITFFFILSFSFLFLFFSSLSLLRARGRPGRRVMALRPARGVQAGQADVDRGGPRRIRRPMHYGWPRSGRGISARARRGRQR